MESNQGQWFVVQALSGHEMKAKTSIDKRLESEGLSEVIFEVLVPIEKVTEVKLGKKTTVNRKFFPGYVLIRSDLYIDKANLNDKDRHRRKRD